MAGYIESQEHWNLQHQILERITRAIGSVGISSELSVDDGVATYIKLSRGGFVVIGQTEYDRYVAFHAIDRYTAGSQKGEIIYPEAKSLEPAFYVPSLAVVTKTVLDGLPKYDGDLIDVDMDHSRCYLFDGTEFAGVVLPTSEAKSNARTGIETYHLLKGDYINTAMARAVLALCDQFDIAKQTRIDKANVEVNTVLQQEPLVENS